MVYDPDLQAVSLYWKKRTNKGAWDAAWTTTAWDDSSGTIGASTILRWTENIGLIGKHTVGFKAQMTYVNPDDTSVLIQEVKDHTFDADRIAEVTSLSVVPSSAGNMEGEAIADEDATLIYVRVAASSNVGTPSSSAGAYHAVINDRQGHWFTPSPFIIAPGNPGWASAVAQDSCGGMGPVFGPVKGIRPDERTLSWELNPSQPDSTGVAEVRVHDSLKQLTGIDFQISSGIASLSTTWSTGWTASSGTVGVSTQVTRWLNVPLLEKHTVAFKAHITWTNQSTEVQQDIKSHTFDANRIANVGPPVVGFTTGWFIQATVAADEDSTDVFMTAGASSGLANPTTGSYALGGVSGVIVSTETVPDGAMAWVKVVAADSCSALGPIRIGSRERGSISNGIADMLGPPGISYTSSGALVAAVAADTETATIYITASDSSGLLDPTVAVNDGSLAAQAGVIQSTQIVAYGAEGWCKAVGANSTGGLGPVVQNVRERGLGNEDLAWELNPSNDASTAVAEAVVHDSDLVATSLKFITKAGAAAWSTVEAAWSTAWDSFTGTLGASTTITAVERISLLAKHGVALKARLQWTGPGGGTLTDIKSVAWDALQIAELTGPPVISFSTGNLALVTMNADPDSTQIYLNVSDTSGLAAPSSASAGYTLAARSGTVASTHSFALGETCFVKAAAAGSDGVAGPVAAAERWREVTPKITDASVFIFDSTTYDQYTTSWTVNAAVTTAMALDIDLFREGVWQALDAANDPTLGTSTYNFSPGDGNTNNHHAVLMLKTSSGGIIQTVQTPQEPSAV